jgi:hypothetical protein
MVGRRRRQAAAADGRRPINSRRPASPSHSQENVRCSENAVHSYSPNTNIQTSAFMNEKFHSGSISEKIFHKATRGEYQERKRQQNHLRDERSCVVVGGWRLLSLLLAVVGGCWRLLAVVGGCCCWRLLAVVGGCWRLLAVVGGCWRLLAVVGGCWRLLAVVGGCCCWQLLVVSTSNAGPTVDKHIQSL